MTGSLKDLKLFYFGAQLIGKSLGVGQTDDGYVYKMASKKDRALESSEAAFLDN